MMMPFVRLLAIYALVGAAIFAFLKRDEIMEYYAAPSAEAEVISGESHAPESDLASNSAPAESQPAATEAQSAPEATPRSQPTPNQFRRGPAAFGSEITPQYFGQNASNRAAAPTVPAPQSSSDLVPRWTQARQVFSQGSITQAAALYEALTRDFPNNPDLHGEAGNLYYNLGQFAEASTHFLRVGEISVNSGNAPMANSMYALLMRIAPTKAATLLEAINAAR